MQRQITEKLKGTLVYFIFSERKFPAKGTGSTIFESDLSSTVDRII